jgi:hypothetical protein
MLKASAFCFPDTLTIEEVTGKPVGKAGQPYKDELAFGQAEI